jgi:hypothetical protein
MLGRNQKSAASYAEFCDKDPAEPELCLDGFDTHSVCMGFADADMHARLGDLRPESLHFPARFRVRQVAVSGRLVVLEVLELAGTGNGAADRGV